MNTGIAMVICLLWELLKVTLDILSSLLAFNYLIVRLVFGSVQSVRLIRKNLRRSQQKVRYRVTTQTRQPRTQFSAVHPGRLTNHVEIPVIIEQILLSFTLATKWSGNPFLNSSRNHCPPKTRLGHIFPNLE